MSKHFFIDKFYIKRNIPVLGALKAYFSSMGCCSMQVKKKLQEKKISVKEDLVRLIQNDKMTNENVKKFFFAIIIIITVNYTEILSQRQENEKCLETNQMNTIE